MAAELALVTLTNVKARLDPESSYLGTSFDTLITSLINEVSDKIERAIGHPLLEKSRTHYLDGDGDDVLVLPGGPLVSVGGVWHIEYGSDGGDPPTRTETATALGTANYHLDGLRSEDHWGLARLLRIDGVWLKGTRNYKVTWTGGIATDDTGVPEALRMLALDMVSAAFLTRDAKGLITKEIADNEALQPVSELNLDRAMRRAIAPFRTGLH